LLAAVADASQSKRILVVPAVTPAITLPTTAPVPALTLTVHGGPDTLAIELAEATALETAVKPPMSATDTDATTNTDENLARNERDVPLFLFVTFM